MLGGIDYRSQLLKTLGLAFVALVGFLWGYYQPVVRPRFSADAFIPLSEDTRRWLHRVSWLLFAVFLGLVGLWMFVARVPLNSLWVLGEGSYGNPFRLSTGPNIGYLYGARDALPTCLLLLVATRAGRRWPLWAWLLILLTLPFTIGDGVRFRALLLVMGLGIFYYLERQKRPSLAAVLAAVFIIFYTVVGGIGFFRATTIVGDVAYDRVIGSDAFTLSDAWNSFLDGSQIVTSSASVVRYIPDVEQHLWGLSFLDFFTQPIPRFLWPGKPTEIGLGPLEATWPNGTAVPFWTLFYINFGVPGILIGMMLWGFVSRWIYLRHRRYPNDPLAQIQLAVYVPFIMHTYGRGGTSFAFNAYALIFILLPVWISWWMLRRRRSQQQDEETPAVDSLTDLDAIYPAFSPSPPRTKAL